MGQERISRRQWFLALSSGIVPAYLTSLWPQIAAAQEHAHRAVESGVSALQFFDRQSAAEIEALAAQIIPSDETPGAREAGVIYFIDRALATFEEDKRELYRKGLAALQAKRAEMYPGSRDIAGLAPEQQQALLRAVEKTEFFEQLRMHTILGFLGSPTYGGNRNRVGWKLIGFEDRASFEPPFGYYDSHAGEGEDR